MPKEIPLASYGADLGAFRDPTSRRFVDPQHRTVISPPEVRMLHF